MKAILSSILLLLVIAASSLAIADAAEYQIDEAVRKGAVDVKVTGNSQGTHSGDCLEAELTNTTGYGLSIVIPLGTMFSATGVQRMVIGHQTTIFLPAYQTKQVQLYAFCAEFNAAVPTNKNNFSLATSASQDLKKVLVSIETRRDEMKEAFKELNLTQPEVKRALQTFDSVANVAVWAVTDNLTGAQFEDWLVKKRELPRWLAEARVAELRPHVNYILEKAGVKARF
jgi:hypothetical protein